ncbi:hypothetical protein RSW84_25650, partial [Escherichia coli]|uniref:hypothetical protein n=1 Tax=Escherichia coli TaxID=562 RepID=UPI0028E01898
DDYAGSLRTFDAKRITLSAGLLEAAKWDKLADGKPGNAVKSIAVTAVPLDATAVSADAVDNGDGTFTYTYDLDTAAAAGAFYTTDGDFVL